MYPPDDSWRIWCNIGYTVAGTKILYDLQALPAANLPQPTLRTGNDQVPVLPVADRRASSVTSRSSCGVPALQQHTKVVGKVIDAEQKFLHSLDMSLNQVAELLRVCVCMHPKELQDARGAWCAPC